MSEEQKKQIGKAHNIKLKKKPVSENMELFYQQSENIFGAYARDLVKLGWSVFPQDAEGRRPGRVFGETIRWAEGHHLKEKLPTKEALDLWCGHCATLNVACVFGPASNNTFAVDIDVTNREMSDAIVEIAENILGPTPFMREGRAPKIAMIYRHSDEEAELIPNISRRFAQKDDTEKSDDGLELLGSGKLITFLGKHHKTGQYFKWLDASPLTMGSDKAPLVTQEQVRKFMEAVDEKFPFHRGSSFEFDHSIDAEDMVGLKAKNILSKRGEGLPWTDDQDGKIIDGREAYLTSLVFSTVRDNINTLNQAMAKGDAEVRSFKAELTLVISEQFEATAAMTDRWRKSYVRSQTKEKVHRLVESVVSGRTQIVQKTGNSYLDKELILPQRPSFPKDRATTISRESSSEDFLEAVVAENYEEFDFLKPNHIGAGGRGRITGELEDPIPGEGSFDIQDRKPISDMVQKGLQEAFTSFLGDVYGDPDGYNLQERKTRVHILKAPTGAGKTSSCIKRIAQDPRTYEDFEWKDQASGKTEIIRAPFVMLLPTYHNIDELRSRAQVLNLDGSLPDDELRIKATEAGLISEDELDAKLAELRRDALNSGLSTMVYSGKIKAGCMVADKVQLAMAVGIGTSPFCETLKFNKDTEKNEIEYCEFYNMCPAIAQRQEIQKQHIVFMPHSFLSLSIPPELNKVRAIIADERIHHLFLHTATFSATSLMITRKPPRLTAREKHDGVMAEELLADRNALSKIVLSALRKGECPAEALVEYRADNTPEGINPYIGGTLVQSALRVCSSAIQRDGKIVPSMSIDDVRELCNTPTGKDIREEFQFWSIIQERIALLRMDRLRNEGTRILERQLITTKDVEQRNFIMEEIRQNKAIPDKACGEKDYRLQLLTDQGINGGIQESIRISWRTKPNWNDIRRAIHAHRDHRR